MGLDDAARRVVMQMIELETNVAADAPIQRCGLGGLSSARDSVRVKDIVAKETGPGGGGTLRNRIRSSEIVRARRHSELEDGSAGLICAGPQSTAVRLDDRTADRQSNPQAALLGRVKRFKDALKARLRQAGA
jgi:hypothetical protein